MTWNLALSSMTKPIYSAIMTGAFTDWSTVPNSGSSGPIVICRRIPGSGTQAVTNLYAGNTGCTAVATPTVDRSNSTGGAFTPSVGTTPGNWNIVGKTTGLFVVEGNGSGDVRKCMDAAYFGGSYTTKDRDSKLDLTVNFGAGGYKAIGVLSLDSLSNSVLTVGTPPTPTTANYGKANGAWQFRALSGNGTITGAGITAATATTPVQPAVSGTTKADGILPTTANIANGDWDLIGIESYNVPARTTGDKLAVVNAVSSAAQSAHVLRTIPALSWASLSLPDSITFNTTLAADNANVVKATNANNSLCAPLQRQY
jgi:hypothetical protein